MIVSQSNKWLKDVCIAHTHASRHQTLFAYIVARGDVQLEEIEIRKALPSPSTFQSPTPSTPPNSALEHTLAKIWQEVLKRPQVGLDDNFFEMGGHSLVAVLLVSEMKKQLNVEMSLSKILECPTVRSLAVLLSCSELQLEQEAAASDNNTVTALRSGEFRKFFFIYSGEGQTLLYLNPARRLPPDFAVYAMVPTARVDIPLAHVTIEEIAAACIQQLERAGETVQQALLLEAFEPNATPRHGLLTQEQRDRFRASPISLKNSAPKRRTLVCSKVAHPSPN